MLGWVSWRKTVVTCSSFKETIVLETQYKNQCRTEFDLNLIKSRKDSERKCDGVDKYKFQERKPVVRANHNLGLVVLVIFEAVQTAQSSGRPVVVPQIIHPFNFVPFLSFTFHIYHFFGQQSIRLYWQIVGWFVGVIIISVGVFCALRF